jgi:hypothetical protein
MDAHRKWPRNVDLHPELLSYPAPPRGGCAARRMVERSQYGGAAKKWNSKKQGMPESEIIDRRKKRRKPRLFHDSICPSAIIMCTWRRSAAGADGNGLDAMQPRNAQQKRPASHFRHPIYQSSRNRGLVPCLIEIKLTRE